MHKKQNGKYATTFELPEELAKQLEAEAEQHPEDNQASIIREGLRREINRRQKDAY